MLLVDISALVGQVTMPAVIAIYGGASLVTTLLAMPLASYKNRHPGHWAVACFFLPLLFLALLLARKSSPEEYRDRKQREQIKRLIPEDLL